MTRKLATIRTISAVSPIPGADKIEVATVDGWKVVVKKGGFHPGDRCLYCEIDSFLPVRPEYEFLRTSSFRKHLVSGEEGFRLRTVRLRGQISQGLVLPVPYDIRTAALGEDVTAALGITIWETPIPAEIAGDVKGIFPAFIPKTDEERVQNLAAQYADLESLPGDWVFREKLDGTSTTIYRMDGALGVCGRNWEYKESETQTGWLMARAMTSPEKLEGFAIQGELVGPGIQGNPYRLPAVQFRPFSLYDIAGAFYCDDEKMQLLSQALGFAPVPHLATNRLPSLETLIGMADGHSIANPKSNHYAEREGFVCRYYEDGKMKASFKVISNRYLMDDR